MAVKRTITFLFTDETELQVSTALYQCLADRLGFERLFGRTWGSCIPATAMQFADLSAEEALAKIKELTPQDYQAMVDVPDEYQAYFAWCVLARADKALAGTFESFCERIAEIGLDTSPGEAAAPDPLAPAAQPGM